MKLYLHGNQASSKLIIENDYAKQLDQNAPSKFDDFLTQTKQYARYYQKVLPLAFRNLQFQETWQDAERMIAEALMF